MLLRYPHDLGNLGNLQMGNNGLNRWNTNNRYLQQQMIAPSSPNQTLNIWIPTTILYIPLHTDDTDVCQTFVKHYKLDHTHITAFPSLSFWMPIGARPWPKEIRRRCWLGLQEGWGKGRVVVDMKNWGYFYWFRISSINKYSINIMIYYANIMIYYVVICNYVVSVFYSIGDLSLWMIKHKATCAHKSDRWDGTACYNNYDCDCDCNSDCSCS